jgi:FMN phosphatase YigB (HAD superfamily)
MVFPESRTVERVVFDLDGTLYDEPRVYDRYAQELARHIASNTRGRFLAEWERAKYGGSSARVGLGYDRSTDLLFQYDRTGITAFMRWDGPAEEVPAMDTRTEGVPELPEVEVPIFGPDRVNIGDWWSLADVIAAHFRVAPEQRQEAFNTTRQHMAESIRLRPQWEPELLRRLGKSGYELTVMSNSPAGTVGDVVTELGIVECFQAVVANAQKPLGLTRWLEARDASAILSIGDNFVNDVEPVLRAGGNALYINRHDVRLGANWKHCHAVASIAEARIWVGNALLNWNK